MMLPTLLAFALAAAHTPYCDQGADGWWRWFDGGGGAAITREECEQVAAAHFTTNTKGSMPVSSILRGSSTEVIPYAASASLIPKQYDPVNCDPGYHLQRYHGGNTQSAVVSIVVQPHWEDVDPKHPQDGDLRCVLDDKKK